MDLVCGTNKLSFPVDDKLLRIRIKRLYELQAPDSIHPFIMMLLNSVEVSKLTSSSACEMIDCMESFLVRRAVCGIEPTGLHAVFKRLWSDLESNFTKTKFFLIIKSHKTVQSPNDEAFKESLIERNLYGSGISNYLLTEWNTQLGGDKILSKGTIEHVLPQTITSYWSNNFNKDQHNKYLHRLGKSCSSFNRRSI